MSISQLRLAQKGPDVSRACYLLESSSEESDKYLLSTSALPVIRPGDFKLIESLVRIVITASFGPLGNPPRPESGWESMWCLLGAPTEL
jgi:hypothetical protein